MNNQDFSTSLLVEQSAEEAYKAVNNVRGWWSEEIEGPTDQLNGVFDYHYEDVHRCQIKVVALEPNKKVEWLVLSNYFKFTKDNTEWTNTRMVFEISRKDDKTQIRLTHIGLVPAYECYDICQNAWTHYIQESLRDLIATGKGQPNGKGQPRTENERRLTEEQQQTIHTNAK